MLETRFSTPDGTFRVHRLRPALHAVRPHVPAHRSSCASSSRSQGTPRIARARATRGSAGRKRSRSGSSARNHIRYEGFAEPAAAHHRRAAVLPRRAALRADRATPPGADLGRAGRGAAARRCAIASCARPSRYWQRWVKHCDIPPLYQQEVIRSALALKLHCFEDTGAIVAAITTSIPESPGSGRTWDYRYCWLRDAYYVARRVPAARPLRGARELHPLPAQHRGAAARSSTSRRSTASTARRTSRSTSCRTGPASRASGPVRVGNGAADTPAARRLRRDGAGAGADVPRRALRARALEGDAASCSSGWRARRSRWSGTPDAGIWEYRTEWQPQTFSSLDVLGGGRSHGAHRGASRARRRRAEFRERGASASATRSSTRAWNAELRQLRRRLRRRRPRRLAAADGARCASCPPTIARLHATVDAISHGPRRATAGCSATSSTTASAARRWRSSSARSGWSRRWPRCGRTRRGARGRHGARARRALAARAARPRTTRPTTLRMWGNFPQAYSHVGLIHAAFAASPRWSDVL